MARVIYVEGEATELLQQHTPGYRAIVLCVLLT